MRDIIIEWLILGKVDSDNNIRRKKFKRVVFIRNNFDVDLRKVGNFISVVLNNDDV